jgi:hypothetical protein
MSSLNVELWCGITTFWRNNSTFGPWTSECQAH